MSEGLPEDRSRDVYEALGEALRGRSEVRLALLFGSHAQRSAGPDLMLAVQACADLASHISPTRDDLPPTALRRPSRGFANTA